MLSEFAAKTVRAGRRAAVCLSGCLLQR
jgi:hypothetical protein